MDDLALDFAENGKRIVESCSHSGICNIVDYARKVSGISNVSAVIGVFHMKKQNEQSIYTIEYFEQFGIQLEGTGWWFQF